MARYNSRPRRSNRRSYYKKKHPNRMAQVLVIGVVVVAAVVFFFNRGKIIEDPNTVAETDINDVVNNMMNEGESRSVRDLPGTTSDRSPSDISNRESNTLRVVAPSKRQDMNAGTNPKVQTVVAQAMGLYKSDSSKMIEVRTKLNKALRTMSMSPNQRMWLKDELTKLADIWLFSKTVYPDDPLCDLYLVASGNRLERIGRNNDVPYQLLMRVNSIKKATSLQAGIQIKIVNGPFNAVVDRSAFTLDLYLKDSYIKTYVVGLGRPGKETPTGSWLVGERLVRPPYTDPDTGDVIMPNDPEYPIGPYFIKLKGLSGEAVGRTGFAIHGTNKALEIGMNTSSGCVRLRNQDVEEVYTLLAEGKSEVRIDP
jgi:lipoprotein-anchoring transpeptidase ErfK/SrfK